MAALLLVTLLVGCGAGAAQVPPAPSSSGGTTSSPAVTDAGVSAGATVAPPSQAAGVTPSPLRALKAGEDWKHVLQVVSYVRAHPPSTPLVLMLGSSIVRESIVSDAAWTGQIRRLGGPAVAAYALGSTNQSFAQDCKLVGYLPDATSSKTETIVFIGVDIVRFVANPSNPTVTLPPAPASLGSYDPHKYSATHILSVAVKQAKARDWMQRRYPVFGRNFSYNLGKLRTLIQSCLNRGYHPVLLDTPRNTAVLGHVWDKPVSRYWTSCRALATEYDIPFVRMVAAAKFVNTDFYDDYHAVQPGRAKWQRRLSAQTVTLLKQYAAN